MKITVVEWKPREVLTFSIFSDTATATHQDRSWCGDILEVLAVNLPYVVIKEVSRAYRIDTRECSLMELTPEYIAAMTPNADFREPAQ